MSEFILDFSILVMLILQYLSLTLALEVVEALQQLFFQIFQIILNLLTLKTILLSELNCRLDVSSDFYKYEESLLVVAIVCIVKAYVVLDVSVVQSLFEFILHLLIWVNLFLFHVYYRSLCFQCLLIEPDYVLGSQF